MAPHRVYFEGDLRPGRVIVAGDEAHHAVRVKRLGIGDAATLLDGRGGIGQALIQHVDRTKDGWSLTLDVARVDRAEPVTPRVEVCSAAPKGSRLADMIDGLSQAGAAAWRYLETDHAAVEPRPAKLDRLTRTAAESSKQCGRAWLMEIGEPLTFDQAITPQPGLSILLADATGAPPARGNAGSIRLLIGPEGGWSPRELSKAKAAGVTLTRLGPHTLRIETAAVIGAALLLA